MQLDKTIREKIENLLNRIATIQDSADRKCWPDGLFPNYRMHKVFGYSRPDNSIFYSASISFILNDISEFLPESLQKKIKTISSRVVENYKDYKSITNEPVYNFYPTNPSKHFANGLLFRHFKHFQLPHDADDSALIYLTNGSSKADNLWLQNKLKEHSNLWTKKIANTFSQFKNLKAYSTWFGKKMPIEFDIVVLCNILYSQLAINLKLDEQGLASWEYIKQAILLDLYIKKPFEVSHNYAKTSVIAYHVAKLICKFDLPESVRVIAKLSEDLTEIFNKTDNFTIDKVLFSSSLYKLAVVHDTQFDYEYLAKIGQHYNFFLAGLLSSFESKFIYFFSKCSFFHLHWRCEAHSLALLVENLSLKLNFQKD